jgi:hypothetical protein
MNALGLPGERNGCAAQSGQDRVSIAPLLRGARATLGQFFEMVRPKAPKSIVADLSHDHVLTRAFL